MSQHQSKNPTLIWTYIISSIILLYYVVKDSGPQFLQQPLFDKALFVIAIVVLFVLVRIAAKVMILEDKRKEGIGQPGRFLTSETEEKLRKMRWEESGTIRSLILFLFILGAFMIYIIFTL